MAFDKNRFERESQQSDFQYHLACGMKIECPSCGQKTLVPYMDKETYEVLTENGRCDREAKCGYFSAPNSNVVSKFISRKKVQHEPLKYPTEGELVQLKYSDGKHKAINSDLGRWLISVGVTEKELMRCTEWFDLGRKEGAIVFTNYNANNRLARFKQMRYRDGKRTKYMSYFPSGNYEKGVFGFQHVCNANTVYVVESEKSAILGFIEYYRKHGRWSCWIATGGANGLTAQYVEKLKGKKIELYPDCDTAGRDAFRKLFAKFENNVNFVDIDKGKDCGFDVGDLILNKWKATKKR